MLKHARREIKMKECNRDGFSECCYLHPTDIVVGVCAFCLNERLLVLAANSNQTQICHLHQNKNIHTFYDILSVKVLDRRIEVKPKKSDHQNLLITSSSVYSQEDTGIASWDKENISKAPLDHQSEYDNCNDAKKNVKSVVDHVKHRATVLRWRRRIYHNIHLIRWKRSNKGSMCHDAKLEGANFRYGWMKNLSQRIKGFLDRTGISTVSNSGALILIDNVVLQFLLLSSIC